MNGTTPNRIVAAVAGDDSRALLEFAAREAVLTQSDLHLVHVMRMPPDLPESFEEAIGSARSFGQLILDRAQRAARELVGEGANVTQELVDDGHGVVHSLVARSEGARLVVLQPRLRTGVRRFTSLSTTQGVSARAHAPVVSVPESWQPSHDRHHRVTVGVHDPAGADQILRTAFAVATQRQIRLRVFHAWWLSSGYDGIVVGDDARVWDDRFRTALAPLLEEVQDLHPDVPVEIQVRHAPVGHALLAAAADSDLLVLGRRHPLLPVGSHLGPVVRGALRGSETPVLLVEPAKSARKVIPQGVDLIPPFS